jgi:serine/threonine-protein kinase RsbW
MNEVTLSVPARPDYVRILRSLTAGVAAQMDFSFDQIEDLRLAVDEACAYLLAYAAEAPTLTLRILASNGSVEVITALAGRPEGSPARSETQQGVIWHILSALTDEARFEEAGGGPAIHFTKRLVL